MSVDNLDLNSIARQADQDAFDRFARVYPHLTYAIDPDRFWEYFQRKFPGVSRDEMKRMLCETDIDITVGYV